MTRTSFPKERIRAVLMEGIHEAGAEILRAEGFQVETLPGSPEPARLAELLCEAHLAGIRSKTRLASAVLAGAPRLLGVGCFCIGTDQVDLPSARERGVSVFNSPYGNTRSVAELTIAECVMLCRRVMEKSSLTHRGVWDKSAEGAREVRGRTLGIVGYGHIGSQVSVLGEAMGMRVVFYDIAPRLALGNARSVGSLDELLGLADIVTLHVPTTELTRGMMHTGRIAKMRPGAMLINNARGDIVDVPGVARAIREGRLAGAAFDVFPHEPSARGEAFESELRGIDRVILTPHIGGSTGEAQEAIARDVAHKLVKLVNIGSTTGSVNIPEVELTPQEGEGEARAHRVLHLHRNVPGVLGRINSAMAAAGINVLAQTLRTNEHVGYVALDVDPGASQAALEGLRSIPETIRARVLW